jgi:hypothetical protein
LRRRQYGESYVDICPEDGSTIDGGDGLWSGCMRRSLRVLVSIYTHVSP